MILIIERGVLFAFLLIYIFTLYFFAFSDRDALRNFRNSSTSPWLRNVFKYQMILFVQADNEASGKETSRVIASKCFIDSFKLTFNNSFIRSSLSSFSFLLYLLFRAIFLSKLARCFSGVFSLRYFFFVKFPLCLRYSS